MTYQEAVDEQIDDIMDEFEFDKVHKVMEFLDWKWWFDGETERVPEVYELRKKAREYLRYVAKHGGTTGSGGFMAQCRKGHDETEGRPYVWLNLHWGFESMNDGICHD
jgi:hypothetical protein